MLSRNGRPLNAIERAAADKLRPDLLLIPSIPLTNTPAPGYSGPVLHETGQPEAPRIHFGRCGDLRPPVNTGENL